MGTVILVMDRIKGTHLVIPNPLHGVRYLKRWSSSSLNRGLFPWLRLRRVRPSADSSARAPRNDVLCHFTLNNPNNSTELPFLVERSDIGKGPGDGSWRGEWGIDECCSFFNEKTPLAPRWFGVPFRNLDISRRMRCAGSGEKSLVEQDGWRWR